jgi:hypothetical protein
MTVSDSKLCTQYNTIHSQKAYLQTVESALSRDVERAQLLMLCGSDSDQGPEKRYSPVE